MKKILDSKIFFFILGAIVAVSMTALAYSINADDVGFNSYESEWNAVNNSEALDDLYEKLQTCGTAD